MQYTSWLSNRIKNIERQTRHTTTQYVINFTNSLRGGLAIETCISVQVLFSHFLFAYLNAQRNIPQRQQKTSQGDWKSMSWWKNCEVVRKCCISDMWQEIHGWCLNQVLPFYDKIDALHVSSTKYTITRSSADSCHNRWQLRQKNKPLCLLAARATFSEQMHSFPQQSS